MNSHGSKYDIRTGVQRFTWVRICVLLAFVVASLLGVSSTARADELYSDNLYGLCEYGRACPTSSGTSPLCPLGQPCNTTNFTPQPSSSAPTPTLSGSVPPTVSSLQPTGEQTPAIPGRTTTSPKPESAEKDFFSGLRQTDFGQRWRQQPWIFPSLLFILLLIMALILSIQAGVEHRNVMRIRAVYERLAQLQEDIKNFLRLLQHNLRTPIATIHMSLELMLAKKVARAAIVSELAQSLSEDVNHYIDSSVAELANPPDVAGRLEAVRVSVETTLKSKLFWAPMLTAFVLVIAYNVLTRLVFPLSFTAQLVILEVLLMFAAILVFMNSVGFVRRMKQQKLLAAEIDREILALERRRSEIVHELSTKLQHDYGLMASSIMQLSETHDRAILLSASQSMQQLLEKFTIVEELQDPEIFQRASQSNFSITEQLETIVQRVQTHSPQRNFEVRLDGLKHAHVMGFVGVIDFVLAAVIQNADRHGDPQGPVIIRATSHAGSIRVIVQNQLTDLNDIDVSKLFHLSLTVLVHYRSNCVVSLGRWSSQLQTGFPVPRPTQDKQQ